MRKTWIGVVSLAVVVVFLAGCIGGVPNPLDHRLSVTLNEISVADDYDAATETVTITGRVDNISASGTSPVDVAVFVWLTDSDGVTLTEEYEAEGQTRDLTGLRPPRNTDIRTFTVDIPVPPGWDFESAKAVAEVVR